MAEPATTEVTLSSATLRRVLLAATALVAAAGLAAEVLKDVYHLSGRRGVVPMLSLSYEQNIPTWYASATLLACSLLLAIIASGARRAKAGNAGRWWLLSAAFLYISLDETASFHEEAGRWFSFGGVLYFGWVIPAAAVVLALGLWYAKFLFALPKRTRNRFILAGALYVGGALLLELPLGYWTERNGSDNLGYAVIDFVEESMELFGVSLFLLALLEYLGEQGYRLAFAPAKAQRDPPALAP